MAPTVTSERRPSQRLWTLRTGPLYRAAKTSPGSPRMIPRRRFLQAAAVTTAAATLTAQPA
ncbi:twin-arginine translocation signal domain-containing protein, partial [Nonomuraea terrae]